MKKLQKKFNITINIPTCYSGESLVTTVDSIRKSRGGKTVKIVITADRTPIKKDILRKLRNLGAEVNWNNAEGSQFKKIKQMVDKCESDIYISTQDDVKFDENTITAIAQSFSDNPSLTMAGIRILPLKPVNFFESAMTSMLRIVDSVGGKWNKTDNHLSSSGRCLAFKTAHIKKFRIPENIVNGDMFFYLENKRLNGEFKRLQDANVFIRCPQRMKDQLAPSSRYLYSKNEMQKYFKSDLTNEYRIPYKVLLSSLFQEFIQRPINTFFYILIRVYTFVNRQSNQIVSNPVWRVDESTKKVDR